MTELFSHMKWDWWEAFGLMGEGLFFARLLVQWTASEKAKKPVLPIEYWYMSLVGCIILIFYAFHLGSFVVLLPQIVGIGLYARNLQLELRHRHRETETHLRGFEDPAYPWPTVSIIVPIHNEAKVLATTLENLCAQEYPGPKPEIIAALNGCVDASWAIAQGFDVKVIESEKAGISFGRNLGASIATGDILMFIDADTTLPPGCIRKLIQCLHGSDSAVIGVMGQPDRGGVIVRSTFMIANWYTTRKRVSPPGGLTVIHRTIFEEIGGFDEKLPQGTNTELILRARAAGAEYRIEKTVFAITSIRRFEKTGVIRQMLMWRQNHRELERGEREKVEKKEYDVVR